MDDFDGDDSNKRNSFAPDVSHEMFINSDQARELRRGSRVDRGVSIIIVELDFQSSLVVRRRRYALGNYILRAER